MEICMYVNSRDGAWDGSYDTEPWLDQNRGDAKELLQLPWSRHQMETFSALLAICAGNSPVSGEFPAQRPVTRSFDVFFDVRVWVNTREAGHLRRYRIHYDVIVMTDWGLFYLQKLT